MKRHQFKSTLDCHLTIIDIIVPCLYSMVPCKLCINRFLVDTWYEWTCWTHSMARANLNKSKKVHTQEAQNMHQLKFPLSEPNLLSKSAFKCETRHTVKNEYLRISFWTWTNLFPFSFRFRINHMKMVTHHKKVYPLT